MKSTQRSYKDYWKRARQKIKLHSFLKQKGSDMKMFGPRRSILENDEDYLEFLKKKHILSRRDRLTKEDSNSYCILHPDSRFISTWNYILVIAIIYTAFPSMYILSFLEIEVWDILNVIELTLDVIYALDFVVTCNTGYFDKDNFVILNRKKILVQYVKNWMVFDLISSIPYSWLDLIIALKIKRATVFKLLRIRYIPKIIRLSRLFKLYKNMPYVENVIIFLSIHQRKVNYFKVLLVTAISVHVAGCLWHLTAVIDDFSPGTWVVRYGYIDLPASEKYFASIYWALVSLITIGYGDISPFTVSEKILGMFWMAGAIYFLSFTVANLASLYSLKATKQDMIYANLMIASEYRKYANISKRISHKIKRCIRNFEDSVYFSIEQKKQVLDYLPYNVKNELTFDMFDGFAKKIKFFNLRHEAFTVNIVPYLDYERFSKGTYLWQTGETPERIIFILSGTTIFITKSHLEFLPLEALHYLGDVELLLEKLRMFNVFVTAPSEFLVLNSSILQRINKNFPEIFSDMKEQALEREKKMLLRLAEAKVYSMMGIMKNAEEMKKILVEQYENLVTEFGFFRKGFTVRENIMNFSEQIKENAEALTRIQEAIGLK